MKAAVIREFGDADVLKHEEIDTPTPSAGHILIKLLAADVSRLDHYIRKGSIAPELSFPHILGGDGAGEVVELGEGVTGLQVGERVIPLPGYPLKDEERGIRPTISAPSFALPGLHIWGTYAQYMTVPARGVVKDDTGLPPEQVATLPIALANRGFMHGSSHECMQESKSSPRLNCVESALARVSNDPVSKTWLRGPGPPAALEGAWYQAASFRGGQGKLRARDGHRGESAASFTWLHDRHGVNIFVSASYVGTGCRRAGPTPKAGPAQAAVDSATEAPDPAGVWPIPHLEGRRVIGEIIPESCIHLCEEPHALKGIGQITAGDTVLLHAGASGSGSMQIQVAKALGASVVTTIRTRPSATSRSPLARTSSSTPRRTISSNPPRSGPVAGEWTW